MCRGLAGVILLSLLPLPLGDNHGPVGTITALATQTRTYASQVKLSYFEAANCTLSFNEDVAAFSPLHFTKAGTTVVSNFVQLSKKLYTFQVSSVTNGNVTLSVAPGAVRNLGGLYNNDTTAVFSFEFYVFAPSVTLRLDGFEAQSTRKERNIAYLLFNSTTQYDDNTPWFNESFVSFSPTIAITDFQQVSDRMYRFKFTIPKNESYPTVDCVAANAAPESEEYAVFACNKCERPQMCTSRTTYPPKGVSAMEFPFSVVLQSVPILGLSNMTLPVVYDTLWAYVQMDAPQYAKEPFYLTITWSEPLSFLGAVQPTFDPSGPPVDQELLKRNLTILSPRSFRLLVAPKRTGILKISINGTQASIDLAGNANDFYRNPASRTGAMCLVIFSAGPPLPGSIGFRYERPRLVGEYPPIRGHTGFQPSIPASLTVSWSGFITATRYDTWVRWGQNLSTVEAVGLNTTQYKFDRFPAMLGVEYQVYIRAFNYFGQSTILVRTFLHPKFDIIADGSKSMVALPGMLSPTENYVNFNVLIPKETFLSSTPLKVLSFRAANRSAGDQDPCRENSRVVRCTYLNFHMEVPASQFVVFRRPIRLQFIFGQKGWQDLYFRPRLRYWETHDDRWRDVAATCPQSQVYDRWNELHRIYEISVCHLTQFAIFEDFEPPKPTTPAPAPPRPESYGGATFFIVLGGVVLGGALTCCFCYFACVQQSFRKPLAYKDMGIKSVNERLPSRRLGSPGFEILALPDGPDLGLEPGDRLLALPPGPAPVPNGQLALPPVSAQQVPAPLQPPSFTLAPRMADGAVAPVAGAAGQSPRAAEAELEPLGGSAGSFGVAPGSSNMPHSEALPGSPVKG